MSLDLIRKDQQTGLSKAIDGRRTLHESALGIVEDFALSSGSTQSIPQTNLFRMIIPYFGAARRNVGSRQDIIDPNKALLLRPEQEYSDSQIGPRIGRAFVVITPSKPLLDRIHARHPMQNYVQPSTCTAPISAYVQMLIHQLVSLPVKSSRLAPLKDDLVVRIARALMGSANLTSQKATPKLVLEVKEILHDAGNDRIEVNEVANIVGSTYIYVTRLFRRHEGFPIYRYHALLRLSRALVELRYSKDITPLAFALSYSSHSHFTAAFSARFGMAPSHFRRWILEAEAGFASPEPTRLFFPARARYTRNGPKPESPWPEGRVASA